MLGEFFREAAVLVLIFYPLEMARSNGSLPLLFVFLVGVGSIVLLLMGIVLEKMRGR